MAGERVDEKLPTGVPSLDGILEGGLPGPHSYLVQGAPGTGKTTMGLQFLIEGVKRGENALFVTLSQTRHELEMIAESHGWSLDGIEVAELQTTIDTDQQTVFYPVDIDLSATRDAVAAAIDKHSPTRLVYDSLAEIRHITGEDFAFQRELLSFKNFLAERKVAALMIDLTPDVGGDSEIEGLAHGIFRLDKVLPAYGRARRRIEIGKMRGVEIFDGFHDVSIEKGRGLVVYPRVVPELVPDSSTSDLIRSGVDDLDDMLGGGMEAGTVTMVIGQPGTGKSTLASLYAHAALTRGESVALFLFEERPETFFRRSDGMGLEMRSFRDEGTLELFAFNPSEISQGRFSGMAQHAVEENGARVVVIDSLTGYLGGLPDSSEAVVQMQLLLKYLSRKGVLTILIVAQEGLLGHDMETRLDVSFLGDTVVLLRMYERPGRIGRTISVVKKRHGAHDLDIRQLELTGHGVRIREFVPAPVTESIPSVPE